MEHDYICDTAEKLKVSGDKFDTFDLWMYKAIGDGNCFFHSLLMGFIKTYRRRQSNDGKSICRRKFAKDLRNELAERLAKPSDPSDPTSPILYDVLARGELPNISKSLPEYSLSRMQEHLRTSNAVGNEVVELTARVLNVNIYLIDVEKSDLYKLGDSDYIYRDDRPSSVVLLYKNGHFDLCGLGIKIEGEDGKFRTKIISHFKNSHPFIVHLKVLSTK